MPGPHRDIEPAIGTLSSLGFTELEARIYTALLGGEAQTGYSVAKSIGKPAANVYKAVESLEAKGAIVVSEGEPRVIRAIEPGELVAALRSTFDRRAAEAEQRLHELHAPSEQEGVYRLTTAAQAFDKARAIIRGAAATVLVDAFPNTLEPLRPELEEAARRGVRVSVIAYQPGTHIEGCRVLVHRLGPVVISRRFDDHLVLATDAQEMMMAQFTEGAERLLQATYTDSLFLSMHFYDSFFCQFVVHRVDEFVEAQGGTGPVAQIFEEMMDVRVALTPGFARYFGAEFAGTMPELPPRGEEASRLIAERSSQKATTKKNAAKLNAADPKKGALGPTSRRTRGGA